MGDCFNKTSSKYDTVDKETLGQLNAALEEIKKTATSAQDFAQKSAKLFDQMRTQSAAQMRAKLANISALRTEAKFRAQPGLIENPKAMFNTYIEGGALGAIEGGGIGIRREAADFQGLMNADLVGRLEKSGTLKLAVEDKAFQQQMVRVAEALEKSPNSDVVTKASPLVREAATIWRDHMNQIYEYKRAGNVPVGRREGYVGIQTHDGEKIKQAGFEAWANDMMPKLDLDETFKGLPKAEDRAAFMKRAFDDIVDGHSDLTVAEQSAGELMTNFEKRRTLGSADSARKFHFKDAGQWFEYNQKYGKYDNIMDMAMHESYRAGLEHAQVSRFGVNAQKGMVDFRDRIRAQAKAELKANPDSPKAQKAYTEAQGLTDDYVRKAFNRVAGVQTQPAHELLVKAEAIYRTANQTRFLGGTVLSSIPDLGTAALTVKNGRTGRGFLEATTRYLGLLTDGASDKKALFQKLGLAVDDALSQMRFNDSEAMSPGRLQKISRFFNKASGMKYWTENVVEAPVVLSAANDLHAISGSKFSELGVYERQALSRVGITDAHWDVIRKAKEDFNGRGIITNEALASLPNDSIKPVLEQYGINKSPSEFKIDARRRLSSYYNDLAALSSARPDDVTRRLLLLGQDPNSNLGIVAKLLTQFKSYPLQFHRNVARFALAGTNELTFGSALANRNFNVSNLAQMTMSTVALSYLGMASKNLAKNQTPDDLSKKETWFRMMKESGMAGIAGDMFFGEYVNRTNGSGLVNLLGPAASDVDKVFQIYGAATRGEKVAPKLYHFGRSLLPGGNLFYLKSALDYSIGYEIQEALNPGSVLRYQQRVQEEGRDFIFGSPLEALR